MKKLFQLLGILLLFACGAIAFYAAPDLSGRWVGVIEVQDAGSGSEISTPVEFQLEQHGDALTGKVGRKDDPDAAPIKSGKVEGDRVTIEVVSTEVQGPAKFSLRVVKQDRLEGEMAVKIEEGPIAGKVKLTREKK